MKSVLPGAEGAVQFDVYRWQNGKWQSKVFRVLPGDEIGSVEDGVDYRTGRVLVDVRDQPGVGSIRPKKIAVLMDRQGRFTEHTDEEDDSDAAQRIQGEMASAE
jgi:hypothetical protein